MKIALGVSGGIAAYKAAEIVRLLQDRGIRVQVVMTAAAQEFVRPLTFAALSGEKVITSMFGSGSGDEANVDSAIEHIAIAQAIDALLVAPATADVLARFAQGIANDFLSTLYLATTAPVVVAPAMNVNMWNHAATQSNLGILRKRGVRHRRRHRVVRPYQPLRACYRGRSHEDCRQDLHLYQRQDYHRRVVKTVSSFQFRVKNCFTVYVAINAEGSNVFPT